METQETLKRRIKSTEDLQSVVTTMKSLAAVNIRQYQRAVESLAEYNRTIEMGFQVLLRSMPEGVLATKPAIVERVGAVVFGSDQGMVGQFNEQVGEYAISEMNGLQIRQQDRTVYALGSRLAAYLTAAGQPVEATFPLPTTIARLPQSVQGIVTHLEDWRTRHDIDEIILFYNRPTSGSSYRPVCVYLLPFTSSWLQELRKRPWPTKVLPTFTMARGELRSALIRQYLLVSLYRAFAESLASENASRLAAMQAAERNVGERLEQLAARYHSLRQSAITEELMDIVSGFEALGGGG